MEARLGEDLAVEHSILVAAYRFLARGIAYNDLGGTSFSVRHDPERDAHRLARQIESLGFRVTIAPPEAA